MNFKKVLALILCASTLAVTGCSSEPEHNDGTEFVSVSATEVAKEMKLGINLGNTMDSHWAFNLRPTCSGSQIIGDNTPQDYETCWGAVVTTQEAIDGFKSEGFNTARIPVYWGNMMEDDGTYTINEDFMNRVEEIVKYCRNAGLYTVINIHHYDQHLVTAFSQEEAVKIAGIVWKQVAERFKDYSQYVVFEGYNEALGLVREGDTYTEEQKFEYVNQMNQAFVDAVRSTGGNNAERVLIVSGYNTNIDRTTSDLFVMPKDTVEDRLMVSVHYVDNNMYGAKKIGGQEWLDYIDSQCELLKKAFTDKGIPVFLGETSAGYPDENFAPNPIYKTSTECLEVVLNKLLDYGFVPVIWDVNDNFYSRTEYKIKSETDRELIKKLSDELNK